jgi:predicted glycoside hydrolase/deacetylase ChbG (UPF0249 family)
VKAKESKQLIVTGDDFGLNPEVNEAIERYHKAGLLTQASLMVNEASVEEAVRIARRNPNLTVGLHLTLCNGRASSKSLLTNSDLQLPAQPGVAGLSYAFNRHLEEALAREITTQFEAFSSLGFAPVYWDGHTHLHLHPTILRLTLPIARGHHFHAVRVLREPGWSPLQITFRLLSRSAIPKLQKCGVAFADFVYGLKYSGRVNTHLFKQYLAQLSPGWSEFYFHPGAEVSDLDCELLTEFIELEGIQQASARDLPPVV